MNIEQLNSNKIVNYFGTVVLIYCLLLMTEILFRQYILTTEIENPLVHKSAQSMVYSLYYVGGALLGCGCIVNLIFKLVKWHFISLIFGVLLVLLFFLLINGHLI